MPPSRVVRLPRPAPPPESHAAVLAAVAALTAQVEPIAEQLGEIRARLDQPAPWPEPERAVTGATLCEILDISEPVLRRLVREGLPYLAAGEYRRYLPSLVMTWLEHREEPTDG